MLSITERRQFTILTGSLRCRYAITGRTGNATAKTEQQLIYYANNQLITERYMLDMWPLFALGDGGDVGVIRSDSLVRVQVYAALAYGARGLYVTRLSLSDCFVLFMLLL